MCWAGAGSYGCSRYTSRALLRGRTLYRSAQLLKGFGEWPFLLVVNPRLFPFFRSTCWLLGDFSGSNLRKSGNFSPTLLKRFPKRAV
jgi:hypothetical protein